MKTKLATFLALLGYTALFAQSQHEFGKIDFSFGMGFRNAQSQPLSLDTYRNLFPESDLLQRDYSTFSSSEHYGSDASTMLNFLWGLRLKANNNFEQRLRVGFTYSNYISSNTSVSLERTFAYDTVTSAQTGQEYYVDSVFSQNLRLSRKQDVLTVDVSYILRSNYKGRFGFYGGMGIEVGAFINARAEVNYDENNYFTNYNVGQGYQNNQYFGVHENFKMDGGFFGQIYMPLGVDLRLGLKRNFWKRIHIYTEIRPALQYADLGVGGHSTLLNFGMAVAGVRHEF